MSKEQIEQLLQAEDILIHLMHDVEENKKNVKIVRRLDIAISAIENILNLK